VNLKLPKAALAAPKTTQAEAYLRKPDLCYFITRLRLILSEAKNLS
jgi:hypothetical protein